MQVKFERVISTLLAVILVLLTTVPIISYAADNMSATELESQGTSTSNDNVEFDVYYDGGKHTNVSDIAATDTKITVSIKVKNAGYVKNATVAFDSANFTLIDDGTAQSSVQSIDVSTNKIVFNQINSGSTATATYAIKANTAESVKSDLFSKDTKVNLEGTYVNSAAKEVSITGSKTIHKEWKGSSSLTLNQTIEKYIPYSLAGKTGLLIQSKVTAKLDNNSLPIKSEEIQATVPLINSAKPSQVIVVANSTKGTNGEETATSFSSANWKYDDTTGIVKINVSNNADANGNIAWAKNAEDEYLITCIYSSDVYTAVNGKSTTVAQTASSTVVAYNNNEITLTDDHNLGLPEQNKVGDFVDFGTSMTSTLNKGYMYNNKIAADADKKETEFVETYTASISYASLMDKITFTQNYDSFATDSTTLPASTYTYDKTVSISKDMFNKILGTNGSMSILNATGTVIGTINSTTAETDGNLIADISSANANNIVIQTTAPQAEGKLEVKINKAINKNIDYTLDQLKTIKTLKSEMIGSANNSTTTISTATVSATANFEEPTSKATISISNNRISTVKNESVEIRAVLETNSVDDYLYKNPTIKIDLPEYITNVSFKSAPQALYNDNNELTIKSYNVVDNSTYKTLLVALDGTQTKYTQGTLANGVTIVMDADLTVNKLAPSKDSQINMTYTNENDAGDKVASVPVSFIAPTGLIAVNSISGYSAKGSDITVVKDEKQTGILDIYSASKTATMKSEVINNYETSISNVKILGRIPSKGQTKIDSNTDEGNTFNTTLTEAITVTGTNAYTVYYSTNSAATNDLANSANAWTTTVTDYSTVKSYLVAITGDMVKGGDEQISYKLNIPANLTHNNQITSDYKVYCDNNISTGTIEEQVVSPSILLTTGEGVELETSLSSDTEKDSIVRTNQYVNMYVTVKNTGKVDATNVNIIATAPDNGSKLATYDSTISLYTTLESTTETITVGNLKAGESVTKQYIVYIGNNKKVNVSNAINDYDLGTVVNTAKVTADTIENGITTNEYNFKLRPGAMSITNAVDTNKMTTVKKGDKVTYYIKIVATIEDGLKNVTVSVPLPKDTTLNDAYLSDVFGNKTGDVTYTDANAINIGTIDSLQSKTLAVSYTIGANTEDRYSTLVTAKADGIDTNYSDVQYVTKGTMGLTATAVEPDDQYVTEGNTFSYKFTIKTTGTANSTNILFKDQLSSRIQYVSATANVVDTTQNSSARVSQKDNLVQVTAANVSPNATINIVINCKVALNNKDEDGLEIDNSATVSADDVSEIKIDSLKYYIEYASILHKSTQTSSSDDDLQPDTNGRYKISGTAWNDANKDGKRDSTESTISGMQVILIYKSNSGLVKDVDSGEDKIATTDSNGQYTFSNLKQDSYIVIFMYDTNQYTLTDYQKSNVAKSVNSDAINMNVQWNGENKKAAATDALTISTENVRNVDIGLYSANTFDLKLDKYISKVTVTTKSTGTKTYNYTDNKKIAKVEIPAKDKDNASVIVEYSIVVTNEGSVTGYVKNIADYFPSDLKFNSELNTNWYSSNSGLYNNSLSEIKLEPGESKTITLVGTKKIDSSSLGTVINNSAEIAEAYNEYAIADTDSTPNNKAQNEDDMSSANLVISVKTGQAVMYTVLAIVVIAILGAGIFLVKTKVLDKKIS